VKIAATINALLRFSMMASSELDKSQTKTLANAGVVLEDSRKTKA